MKKFIVSVLCVATFFLGLGSIVDKVGAKFKSDERALALIKQARQAIGGEANIVGVQSLSVTGKATKSFEIEGVTKSEQGDWELNLQLPNKFRKMMKVEIENNGGGEKTENMNNKVVIIRKDDKTSVSDNNSELPKENVVIVRKGEGDKITQNEENSNGQLKKVMTDDNYRVSADKMEHNEFFRTTLSLLLSAPQGTETEYLYSGDGSVDGSSCDIVEARNGGTSVKLFLDKSTHLPKMMSYTEAPPMIFFRIKKDDANTEETSDNKVFTRKLDAPQTAEFQVKFSDYRSVNGLQLPFLWTQTVGGRADETVEISNYEINPANIADKFKEELPQRIMIKTERKQ